MPPLLNNVNYEVCSNEKDEIVSTMAAVTKVSNVVTHYASHFLRDNVQFSAIEKNMQSTKTDPSIVYMVPDHNKKVLQMRYHEGQADYFCKKGMGPLGMVELRWKVDGKISGFKYSFVDYVIKG